MSWGSCSAWLLRRQQGRPRARRLLGCSCCSSRASTFCQPEFKQRLGPLIFLRQGFAGIHAMQPGDLVWRASQGKFLFVGQAIAKATRVCVKCCIRLAQDNRRRFPGGEMGRRSYREDPSARKGPGLPGWSSARRPDSLISAARKPSMSENVWVAPVPIQPPGIAAAGFMGFGLDGFVGAPARGRECCGHGAGWESRIPSARTLGVTSIRSRWPSRIVSRRRPPGAGGRGPDRVPAQSKPSSCSATCSSHAMILSHLPCGRTEVGQFQLGRSSGPQFSRSSSSTPIPFARPPLKRSSTGEHPIKEFIRQVIEAPVAFLVAAEKVARAFDLRLTGARAPYKCGRAKCRPTVLRPRCAPAIRPCAPMAFKMSRADPA